MSTQRFQRCSCAPMRCSAGGCATSCSRSNQGRRRARCCKASSMSASSARANRGDRSARASDRSCAGDTRASSSATRSCTSGASPSRVFSGCCDAMPSARSSCCMAASRSRLRASTMMSRGCRPRSICCASQRAACRHSSARSVSSTLTRGVVRLSRHPATGAGPRASRSGRAICGSASAAPATCDSVLWPRKPGYSPCASACPMTWLTCASTAGALRRV